MNTTDNHAPTATRVSKYQAKASTLFTSHTRSQSKWLVAAVAATALAAAPVFATAAAQTRTEENTMTTQSTQTAQLVGLWLELWNGDYSQAESFISPNFQVHAALLGGGDSSAIRGPQGLITWVQQTRAAVPDLTFTVEVGPIVQDDYMVVRWSAEGTYAGGMPGATAPAGTPVSFTGTDILRLEGGQLAEYWINSDTLLLLTQLGVVGSGS